MEFRETLKGGMVVLTKRNLTFYRKHDTHVTTEIPANTSLIVWGFERFNDDTDPMTQVEIECLYNADLWCLPIPHGEYWTDYLTASSDNTEE